MGLFSKIFSKTEDLPAYGDEQILVVADAEMVPPSEISDEAFAQELMGQTIGFKLKDSTVVSPCNGKLEVMFPTGHAFAVRMENGQGILVHIGINTVNMNGKGFKVFAKQGESVKAGQKIVEVDLQAVKDAGYDSTTMLIITEPVEEGYKENFIDFGDVTKGQVINNK